MDAIQMLAAAKKAAGKVPGPDQDEMGRKVFQDKEFLYPGLTDAWIYRNGQTKSRAWYLRVKTKLQDNLHLSKAWAEMSSAESKQLLLDRCSTKRSKARCREGREEFH